jgi:3-oxoisoapionate decarboxylase
MQKKQQRRSFLKTICGVAAAPLLSTTAAHAAAATPGLRLGYDSYSIRAYQWKALQHIEYAASLQLDTAQIALNDYESLDPAYLAKVKDAADRAGIQLEGGIGCICPTAASFNKREGTAEEYALRGLRACKAVGAKAMRCFLGGMAERRGNLPIDAHIEATIKVFRNIRTQAIDTGVKLALENHNGDLHAVEVRQIVEAAGKDLVGVTYDSANPMWLLEDPMMTLETLAPYIVTSHFRDSAAWESDKGIYFQWVVLGEGTVDMPALVARFRELCPQAPMQLEIITGRPPQLLPCYSDGNAFWKAYPKVTGEHFARFAALAKRGRPYAGPMMTASTSRQPAEYDAALKLQQKLDLERSFEYARTRLGAGIKNRSR